MREPVTLSCPQPPPEVQITSQPEEQPAVGPEPGPAGLVLEPVVPLSDSGSSHHFQAHVMDTTSRQGPPGALPSHLTRGSQP